MGAWLHLPPTVPNSSRRPYALKRSVAFQTGWFADFTLTKENDSAERLCELGLHLGDDRILDNGCRAVSLTLLSHRLLIRLSEMIISISIWLVSHLGFFKEKAPRALKRCMSHPDALAVSYVRRSSSVHSSSCTSFYTSVKNIFSLGGEEAFSCHIFHSGCAIMFLHSLEPLNRPTEGEFKVH